MADAPPPPVAIRITRPYESEEEYLAQELEMISKTSITLVGAQPRPQGVVLRFELVLAGGAVLVRGEGRVVGFKPNAHRGVGGLTLRFTRIDARSKALLDKATSLREQRRPSSKPPQEAVPPPLPAPLAAPAPAAPPPAEETPLPPVLSVAQAEPSAEDVHPPPVPVPPGPPSPPLPVVAEALPAVPASPPLQPLKAVEASKGRQAGELPRPERDSLLDRLRTRVRGLDADAVQRILDQRKRA